MSASSAARNSSESTGTRVFSTRMVPPSRSFPLARWPGNSSICMSLSGVLGRSCASASENTAGSLCLSTESVTIDRPSWSSVFTTSPTRTPATLTGWFLPDVKDWLVGICTLTV